jgi:hypothetical protein
MGVVNAKNPTVVLVTKAGEFVDFGYDARRRYSEMDEEQANYAIFERFKMRLAKSVSFCIRKIMQSVIYGIICCGD